MTCCLIIAILSFASVEVAPVLDLEAGDTASVCGSLIPAPPGHAPGATFIFDDDPFDDDDDNDGERKVTARPICRGALFPVAVVEPERFSLREPLFDISTAPAELHLRI